jgi:hypothetical protein
MVDENDSLVPYGRVEADSAQYIKLGWEVSIAEAQSRKEDKNQSHHKVIVWQAS